MPPESQNTPAPPNTPPQPPPAGGGDQPRTVAYENFQSVVTAKEGLERQVAELKTTNQQLLEKAATVDTLSGQVNEWKGKATAALGRFAVFTELSGALGTQEVDVIDSFEAKYQATPEAGRPDRKAWVDALKAKPDTAPAVLRPWLGATSAASPADGTTTRPPQPRPPGSGNQPGATTAPTAEQVRAIREKAIKTGDWSEWKVVRKQLGAK